MTDFSLCGPSTLLHNHTQGLTTALLKHHHITAPESPPHTDAMFKSNACNTWKWSRWPGQARMNGVKITIQVNGQRQDGQEHPKSCTSSTSTSTHTPHPPTHLHSVSYHQVAPHSPPSPYPQLASARGGHNTYKGSQRAWSTQGGGAIPVTKPSQQNAAYLNNFTHSWAQEEKQTALSKLGHAWPTTNRCASWF